MSFVPLHVYSGYSFLKSGLSVSKIVGMAVHHQAHFCAVCDLDSLSGAPELEHLCQEYHLAPIFGMDVEIEGSLLSLFVQSEEGYRNLLPLLLHDSQSRLTLAELKAHVGGLAVVLDAEHSFIHELCATHPEDVPARLASFAKGIPDFRLGVPYSSSSKAFAEYLRAFAAEYPYALIAYPHIAYLKKDDAIVTRILQAIENDEKLEQRSLQGDEYFLEEALLQSYYLPSEIEETEKLAQSCLPFHFSANRGGLLHFPVPQGETSASYLEKCAEEGLAKRNPGYGQEYAERLAYELSVIEKMGYADYFLIVADYVGYAKAHGISVGPGRGSGAGSLVSYALGIVKPDPIKYGLLFERFLNPERKSMPDIDVDFADVTRDQVALYLQEKYGKERVSHVMTMQTIAARQSLNDIGRVYGYAENEVRLVTSCVDPRKDLRANYRSTPAFRELVDSDKYYLDFVALAAKIEGLPRQSGLHAAGIVLNDAPLETCIPVVDQEGVGYVEQFDKDYLQEQGFLKMDLLGLRNLTLVDNCLAAIKAHHGLDLPYADIPFEDPEPIAMIASGCTMGLFQLESPGMNRAIAQVHPTTFEDVCAVIALFRPGPMDNIPSFAARKAGKEPISYLHPCLAPILSSTYGVIVYQEQIMQIVRAMAGFSYGEADLFRRAISHKNAQELAALKGKFLEGCAKQNQDPQIAEKVYALIYKFADYGFNKSHSLCYALLACQMAYLKYHYPLEFYGTILDQGGGGKDKLPRVLEEIKKRKIRFLLPDINQADDHYEAVDGALMLPLSGIDSLPRAFVNSLLDERNLHGPFLDLFDLASRAKPFGLTLPMLIRLIDAGALDGFDASRASLRASAPAALRYAEVKGGESGHAMLLDFDLPKPALQRREDNPMENLLYERDAIGMMVSGSPLDAKKEAIAQKGLLALGDLDGANGEIRVAAIIGSVKAILTKKGTKMAFLTAYDATSQEEFTLFSDVYSEAFPLLHEGSLVAIACRKDARKEGTYIATKIEAL